MANDKAHLTDVEYFESMLLAKAIKYPEERKTLKISSEHFHNARHGRIYDKLVSDDQFTTEDLLTESVRNPDEYGDYEFVRGITEFPIATSKGIMNDQLQIYDFYKQRVIAAKISDYQNAPTNDKAMEISKTIEKLENVDLVGKDSKMSTLLEIANDLYGENKTTVIKTGFDALDNIITGFEPQQLNIIGARPSMGKTAFSVELSQNIARQGYNVRFLSLETTEKNLTQRLLSSISRVELYKIKNPVGRMTESEIERVIDAMDVFNKMPLQFDDVSGLTPNGLRRIINSLNQDVHHVIMIDYLTLMRSDGKTQNSYEETTQISKELKNIVQEKSNITLIALSQLRRPDGSKERRPVMSDLRQSGQVEQDANMIMMLYRDDYEDTQTKDPSGLEVIVTKNKDGGLGTAELEFYKNIQKIY